ncbi:uncharacterized protein [Haliotis asinina]|uniref:uncharacterized protein n=1 Tax=Haliotis asinina TaxID=109174 RepID=UPI00353216A7
MYPKMFTTRKFKTASHCQNLITSKTLSGKTCEQCCQNLTVVEDMRTYELPAKALLIPGQDNMYKDFVTQCIGRQYCQLNGKDSDRIQMDWNCIMFEYECVDDDKILSFTGDSTLKDSQVFLLDNQAVHSDTNSHCVAYTCQSSITVKLVGNTVNSSSCTLVFSEEGGNRTILKCNDTVNNILFQSNTSKIDITLNKTASVGTSTSGLLWILVTASANKGLVSVACGSKIPSDVTHYCPKVTTTTPLVPSVMTGVPDTSDTPTSGTTRVKGTPSVTMILLTTESNTAPWTSSSWGQKWTMKSPRGSDDCREELHGQKWTKLTEDHKGWTSSSWGQKWTMKSPRGSDDCREELHGQQWTPEGGREGGRVPRSRQRTREKWTMKSPRGSDDCREELHLQKWMKLTEDHKGK